MARLVFPDEGSQLVYRISGVMLTTAAGATATVYSNSAGTVPASIATHDGTTTPGAVIVGSTLTVNATSRLPLFWGPDSVDTVYVKVDSGPVTAVYARTDDRLDALIGTVGLRTTALYTTTALGAGAYELGSIAMAKGYRLLQIQTSAPARVRLYTTAAKQATDAARAVGVDPDPNAGVVLDYLTAAGYGTVTAADLSPVPTGASTEAAPVTAIPITVTAVGAGAITVSLTYVSMEV